MFIRNSKKAFMAQKLVELREGTHPDSIILDLLDFQVMDTSNRETPPFIIKMEYQALLDLPLKEKLETLVTLLGSQSNKNLIN